MLKKVLMTLAILFIVVASLIGYGIHRFFNQFGDPVNKEISDSYYYSRDQNEIIYSPMGNWFELGKNKMDVDMPSFEVVGRDYAKDKNKVYFKSRAIDFDIDISSFHIKYRYIPMDKNHVYVMEDDLYYLSETKEGFVILQGADPETYTLLSYNFAKDKNGVYMNNQRITNVDHHTFEVINDYFSMDNDSIYFYQYQKPLLGIKGNPSKTDVISSTIIKDDQYVYWVADGNEIINLPFKDSSKIEQYSNPYLLRIDDHVYFKGGLLKYADPDTFGIVEGGYFKDKDNVFYWEEIIEEADVESFQVVEFDYAKDKKRVYYAGKAIPEADPATFRYNQRKFRFEDKNHYYETGKVINK